jgi:hypothetical protein
MFRLFIPALVALSLVLSPGPAAAAKDYSADRFDVETAIQPDGSLLVTETVVFRFVGGPFTFAFRELETDNTDGITGIEASMDGAILPLGKNAGQVEIGGRDPIEVRWHFAPVSDAVHTFVLKYRVLGAVRQAGDGDVLVRQPLPNDYDYPIASSTVRVTWPEGLSLVDEPQVRQGQAVVTTGDAQAVFTARDLRPDSPLVVVLRFPAGSLIAQPPVWQARSLRANALAPVFAGLALAVLAIGVGALALVYNRADRRAILPFSAASPGARPSLPPGDLPPAIVGAITGSGASPAWPGALATLLDLGRRGVITIEESPERKWYRGRDFIIRLLSQPSTLRPHERGLLAILFETKKGPRASVKVSQLSGSLSSQLKKFSEPLKDEMGQAGLLSPARQRVKDQFNVAGVIALAAGIVGVIAAALLISVVGGWAFLVPFGLIGVSIAAFIMAASFSPLSDEGAQEAGRWRGFRLYLEDVLKGREPLNTGLFEPYLPYAAAFGLVEKWTKLYSKQKGIEVPAWFRSLATADGTAAFVAMIAATSAAGSSGAGGGGVAGGASGGGASGAG